PPAYLKRGDRLRDTTTCGHFPKTRKTANVTLISPIVRYSALYWSSPYIVGIRGYLSGVAGPLWKGFTSRQIPPTPTPLRFGRSRSDFLRGGSGILLSRCSPRHERNVKNGGPQKSREEKEQKTSAREGTED